MDDVITIESIINEELTEEQKRHVRKVVTYLIEVVRGYKIPKIKDTYILSGEFQISQPEIFNLYLDQIITKMRTFRG